MTEIKAYSCDKCGEPFRAVPPNDVNIIALSKPCEKGDSIEVPYDFKNCDHVNVRHWDIAHGKNDFERISVS